MGPVRPLSADPIACGLLLLAAFTLAGAAQTAYAIANLYRQRGAITILGGPHARSYPEDA